MVITGMEIPNILLSGITGSRSYGLATEDSDTDRLGIFAHPTEKILGIAPYERSSVSTHPDVTFHEAGKMARIHQSPVFETWDEAFAHDAKDGWKK